jgi:hypothetical protein
MNDDLEPPPADTGWLKPEPIRDPGALVAAVSIFGGFACVIAILVMVMVMASR